MNALSLSLSALAATSPPPQAEASSHQNDDAPVTGFSRCLDQARERDHTKASERQAPKDKVRSAREADATPEAERTEPAASEDIEADADSGPTDTDNKETAAPDLAALLPGWTPPSATPSAATPITTAGNDSSASPQEDAPVGGVKSLPSARDGSDVQTLTRLAAAPKTADAGESSASGASLATKESQHVAAPEAPTLQAPMAMAAATPVAAAPRADNALPTATIHAPLHSPAFAPSLAAQVRWWAQDGVQQAQLTLNPAEMGPVTVQISLDGREARIDFRADMAATRSALEASLPALAAALDENGLTLTGGGVHDGQTPQHHAHANAERGRFGGAAPRAGGNAQDSSEAPRRPPSAARGLVDLMA